MAKTTSNSTTEPNTPRRPSLLRLLLTGVVLFLLVSIALQTCGINILVTTTSKEKLIDKPHSPERRERDVPDDLGVPEE